MNRIVFRTIDSFDECYSRYQMHKCDKCDGLLEMSIEPIEVIIEDRFMQFKDLSILKCIKCESIYLNEFSKKIIDGCYKTMLEHCQYRGEFWSKGYKKVYDYCSHMNFVYDHRDYESIPGLCHDDEHSTEGFLTPVFFSIKSLLYPMHDPDYNLNLASETYGHLSYKDEWIVSFGINRNNKVVFWLGDLAYMDDHTLEILKPHNVESDHQLVDSEFYAGQMCCIWSEPNRELKLCYKKFELFDNIESIHNLSLHHLTEESKEQMELFQKPIVFTEKSIEPAIEMLNKVLIEGVNLIEFRKLYEKIYPSPSKGYTEWKSIKLYQSLLENIISDDDNIDKDKIRNIMAPLYLLNDLRNYYDHLLPTEKREDIKKNIVNSLGLKDFKDIELIYNLMIDGLLVLFEYLLIGNSLD